MNFQLDSSIIEVIEWENIKKLLSIDKIGAAALLANLVLFGLFHVSN
jgi:hypothetical protein